ncbi:hypothetical protein [Riemerella anatipestifer]|uniref:hypothetical protein n=1 Tax=Riemerella anatipestifer TaxID=34085 RepID=UPI001372886B|nr:hypothetical protein [Riemerella anatipestifer]MBT0550412.1 hypothetical protein [Riemerella anatipestifer]MBT0557071.1 hypothetical protein [Riemerella anatipestifer]MBT0561177.1 hypothetical protein [Riemerella anatipestifer]NAV17346.1 hypothetical protein [Riemerella anatipestifer]UZX27996.1 hypothetical protein OIS45_00920 [Riemerella anatipestifer]
MKIQVKIEKETLQLLNRLMEEYSLLQNVFPNNKTSKSMLIELRDILLKKEIHALSKRSRQPIEITIRYHIGQLLYVWIKYIQKDAQMKDYEVNKLEVLKSQIYMLIL